MQSIYKIFQKLQNRNLSSLDDFEVISLPATKFHKIGISSDKTPKFFIKSVNDEEKKALTDVNLEFIQVQFNRECQLVSNEKFTDLGLYSIISLKSDLPALQEYFINIVYLIVKNLPEKPSLNSLKIEIEQLVNLFSKFSNLPTKTIQGLWSELLVIQQSNNPDYLIRSWHISANDKFDFNDGKDKLEIKSTSKSRRIHNFSNEQLNPNINSNLLIGSVFAVETGIGKSIFDLIDLIEKDLKDNSLLFRVNEIVAQTLGKDFERAFDVFFDYRLGADNLQYYNNQSIPKIPEAFIPSEITNLKFDCDLTGIEPIRSIKGNSILHNSLF